MRWLRVLGCVFLRPLEAAGLLPADELRALLPNLPAVRERHAKLYAELKALRGDPARFVVRPRPVADALLATLGDAGYAPTLARFCRGQRMALDALKERRRKNKELHQFLASREQLPLCGRLQLRDLLACVWQRSVDVIGPGSIVSDNYSTRLKISKHMSENILLTCNLNVGPSSRMWTGDFAALLRCNLVTRRYKAYF